MTLAARPDAAEAARAVGLLRALVQADSINPPGNTTRVAAVARAALHGLPVEVIAAHPAKPNIVVRLDNGPGPVVHLNAHLDTVPPPRRSLGLERAGA